MTAVLLTLALFAGFWLIGLALLALVGADTANLRVALTAPAVGAALSALAAFTLSYAGLATDGFAIPLTTVLLVGAGLVLLARRPRIPRSAWLVVAIAVGGFLAAAWPMFSLGFRWVANANSDMSVYVLSAQQLLHHGLAAPLDVHALNSGRDYATAATHLQRAGGRPGGDLLLSLLSALSGRNPYEVFMPLMFALGMGCICSVGALACGDTRPRWTAPLAAGLLAISALAVYGSLQQLLAQAVGLTIATALVATLLRGQIHREPAPWLREIVPLGILLAAVVLSYIELASTLALIYLLYLAANARRHQISLRALVRLWVGPAVIAAAVLNTYLGPEASWLSTQVSHGAATSGNPPLFGYSLIPTALPALLGLKPLAAQPTSGLVGLSIAVAAIVLLVALAISLRELWRGSGLAAALVAYAVLAAYLASRDADFGMFKLMMYAQPFLAAGLAAFCGRLAPRRRAVFAVPLLIFAIVDVGTAQGYVRASVNPGDFPNGSAQNLLPVVARAVARSPKPLVVAGTNPVFVNLTSALGAGKRVFFIGRNTSASLAIGGDRSILKPVTGVFGAASGGGRSDQFILDAPGERALSSESCTLIMPTGSQLPFNRVSLPAGSGDLAVLPCSRAHNLLAFTDSTLGEDFYLAHGGAVGVYQLEPDPFFPGRTMAGLGRFLLFQVVGATAGMRLELNYSFSLIHNGANSIPPSAVLGARRYRLPVAGDGSARLFSAPLEPEIIDGHPYLLLDVGRNGQVSRARRRGLDDLFGGRFPLDIRRLTGYLRDVSLLSASQYAELRPPLAVSHFPQDLENPALAYSGTYEDGWAAEDSYFVLAGGSAARLKVAGMAPGGGATQLEVLVNGRRVASTAVHGAFSLERLVGASRTRRRVELRFNGSIRLAAPDYRPASALLSFVGFVPR